VLLFSVHPDGGFGARDSWAHHDRPPALVSSRKLSEKKIENTRSESSPSASLIARISETVKLPGSFRRRQNVSLLMPIRSASSLIVVPLRTTSARSSFGFTPDPPSFGFVSFPQLHINPVLTCGQGVLETGLFIFIAKVAFPTQQAV